MDNNKAKLTELEILRIIKLLIEILEEKRKKEVEIGFPYTIMEDEYDNNKNKDDKYSKKVLNNYSKTK